MSLPTVARAVCCALGVLLAACGASPAPTTTLDVSVRANVNPAPPASGSSPVLVGWSAIESSPGCFFFSGPRDLGRDDHLGQLATLALSANGAQLVFDGALTFVGGATGPTLSLVRTAPHDYGGTWTTRETIVLSRSGETWVGTYHYDEHDGASAAGTCHIDASLVVGPR